MAGYALLHDGPKRRQRRPHVIAHTRVLGVNRKLTGSMVHRGPDVLHPLRHKGRDVRCPMQL